MAYLTIVNCTRFRHGQPCEILSRVPTPADCGGCVQRNARSKPEAMLMLVVNESLTAPRLPGTEEDNFVYLCEWRVRENYTEQGKAILLAGKAGEIDGKWIVSRAAHKAAQAHRA